MQSFWQNAGGLLNQAKASGLVEKAREAAAKVAETAAQVSDTVQAEYRRTFVDLDCEIQYLRPNLCVMEYPSDDKIERLAARLNADHAGRMLILNMSERPYDTAKFHGEVVDVAFRGLPSPPVELLMELCLSGHHWLESDESNVLVVHCFQGFSRSAVFASCFMAFRGLCAHPADALQEVCSRLELSDKTAIVPSQRRYLAYFQQCQQGLSPGRAGLRLQRAQLNGIPRFESEGSVAFRPFIEVWGNGELLHSSQPRPGGSSASAAEEGVAALPQGFAASDLCASFQLPPDTIVSGDVLIRVRHVSADGKPETALRLAFHTGFVPEGTHFAKHELDSACDDGRFPDDFFLDLIFEAAPAAEGAEEAAAQSASVFEKAREVGKRNREEEQRRAELAAQVSAAAADDDHFAALEETLRRGSEASSRSGSAAPSSGGAAGAAAGKGVDEELKKALAAAAGDDSPANAKTPSAKAPSVSAASPVAGEVPAASAADLGKKAQNEIDDLFGEFDAALASVGGGAEGGSKGAAPKPAAAKPAASKAADDDPFGDVDDFLKELDA